MKTVFRILIMMFSIAMAACRSGAADHATAQDAKACYEQALAAFDADSVTAGEQLLNTAIRLADESGDLHTLYLAQLRLAQSLSWGNSEAALQTAKQALATYERNPDSPRNHIIILDYIGTYASQLAFNGDENYDEAIAFATRAYTLAVASKDTLGNELVSQTLTSLANIHWAMDDLSTALRYARDAVATAPADLLFGAQQVLARCLVSCDSLAAAEALYRTMDPSDDVQASYIIQSNLAKLALQRHDNEAAESAVDEAFQNMEDLYFKALKHKDDYYQNALTQEREDERVRYTAALHRRLLWAGLILLLVLLAAALLAARAERAKRRQQVLLRQQDQQMHRQETELRQQQLLRQANELRMRDATVDFLQNYILQRTEVFQKIGQADKRHIALTAHEWAEVERTLNAIDGDRFANLRERYPNLREEDVQLCMLTRLRLANRAIGNIYGLTISAVQHRKLKLKKDLFGEDDPETTLEQVIDTFSSPVSPSSQMPANS